MFSKRIFIIIITLAMVSMACGISVNIPVEEIKTGPTQTMAINVPVQESVPVSLTFNFGSGELNLSPGAQNALVAGTATYNVEDYKPVIKAGEGNVSISTGKMEVRGFPRIQLKDVKNTWDLLLGAQPMNLEINAGAYKGDYELGGLALENLRINDGAAEVKLAFNQPNLVVMKQLIYSTGASQVSLSNLANANFTVLTFRSGAGNYSLDFSGQLNHDASVFIESGLSQVTLTVPEGVNALVSFEGGMANINATGDWEKEGNSYRMTGSGPTITIQVSMGAGNLELRN